MFSFACPYILLLSSFLPTSLRKLLGYLYLNFCYGDLVGYESLIRICEVEKVTSLPGDIIEVGAFIGGGTRKLAQYFKQYGKKVYAIDVFNPYADLTTNANGVSMADVYIHRLSKLGLSMFQAYWFNVGKMSNVVTIPLDSKKVRFPKTQRFCFGFVDGNHSPEYVVNDFYLVWNHLTPGGMVAFHDYGYNLPQVTNTINQLIKKHAQDIEKIIIDSVKHVIFIKKKLSRKSV